MVKVADTHVPIETKDGFMLASVPNGNLGWVKLAELREWVGVTLCKRLSDGVTITRTEFIGPPDAARQWIRYWEQMFSARLRAPGTEGYFIEARHAGLDGDPHTSTSCCKWCCDKPLEHDSL